MDNEERLKALGKELNTVPKNVGHLIALMLETTDVYDFSAGCDEDEGWVAEFGPLSEGYGDTFDEAVLEAAEYYFKK